MKVFSASTLLCFLFLSLGAQVKKNPDNSLFPRWESLKSTTISNHGNFILWEQSPNVGDSKVIVYSISKEKYDTFNRTVSPQISFNEKFFMATRKPSYEITRALKVKKTKADDFPKDSLLLYHFDSGKSYLFSPVKRSKMGVEGGSCVALLFDKSKNTKEDKKAKNTNESADTNLAKSKSDTLKKNEVKPKSKRKAKGTDFFLFDPVENDTLRLKEISDFDFSKNGKLVLAISNYSDTLDSCRWYIIDAEELKIRQEGVWAGTASLPACSPNTESLAMLVSNDTSKTKHYQIVCWKNNEWTTLVDSSFKDENRKFEIQEKGGLYFSEDGQRLFFGLSEPFSPNAKDSIPEDEKYSLDLWSWNDPRLPSEQNISKKNDENFSLTAFYDFKQKKNILIGSPYLQKITPGLKGNAPYALVTDKDRYEIESSYTVHPANDYYWIDLTKGEKRKLLTQCRDRVVASPSSRWILIYSYSDSMWYSLNPMNDEKKCLTIGLKAVFYDFENDVPTQAEPLGIAGWSDNEKYAILYDKSGFWMVDPNMTEKPFRPYTFIEDNKVLRLKMTDPQSEYFSLQNPEFVTSYDRKSKKECFGTIVFSKRKLTLNQEEDYSFQLLKKAKNNDRFLFQKSNYTLYPDLSYSQLKDPKKTKVVSSINSIYHEYKWGKVQLVKYKTLSGKELEGLLYTPDSLISGKKYPMIVYYYEKYSDKLHQFYGPGPSRSVISFPFYAGNDYVVFIPDIVYENGKPGESAYDCIMGGVNEMLKKYDYIDSTRMGLQGQSWGGYQTAYMVTRTNRFKAAMAGAPVVNMTSAYGGIRWESGKVRQFQYEEAQSRIGKTLWDGFELYVANSPLFFSDKISTPLLIMSNDNDGAVPYYQGIEWITALRRLQKPAWMLCYNNDEHNLMKYPNRVDLSIRMQQFFDYYLKGMPMPLWMKEGINALEKGVEDKYELEQE